MHALSKSSPLGRSGSPCPQQLPLLNAVAACGSTDTVNHAAQVCAVIFLHLFILLQFSIVLTRNPSFFWNFGKKTAPPPSIFLLLPVCVFTVGATFVAVYWPADVQPDGGRGQFEGAGGTHPLCLVRCSHGAPCSMAHDGSCSVAQPAGPGEVAFQSCAALHTLSMSTMDWGLAW